jgi:RimJ/RimL family protein N-acetyltransferase
MSAFPSRDHHATGAQLHSAPGASSATAVTAYGLLLQVRPLAPADHEPLVEFFTRLSDSSRFQRFMTGKPTLSGRDVKALTDVDHRAREVLVAADATDGSIVAEARYAQWPREPDTADVAFAVADEWQRQGIGTMLAAEIVRRARARGFRRLTASTFGGNAGARAVLRRVGFRTSSIGGGVADLSLDLR